jgi:hypothetical protein
MYLDRDDSGFVTICPTITEHTDVRSEITAMNT